MVVTTNGHDATTRTKKKTENKIPDGHKLIPPDGNYAWIVAAACFVAGLVTVTSLPTYSVLLYDLIILYETNTATISWVTSISLTTAQFLGPVNTVIVNTFGVRKSAIMGGLVISLGMTTSYLVRRIELLCLTYGIIIGFGTGLCHTCYPVVLSQYFRKYYGVAIGLLTASFATARLVLTPLAQYLLEVYGCRGVFLILGANTLHICAAAALFQPVKRHLVLVPIDVDAKELLKVESVKDDCILKKDTKQHDDFYIKDKCNLTNDAQAETLLSMPISDDKETRNELLRINSITMASPMNDFGSVTSICATQLATTNGNKMEPERSNCVCLSWCFKEICGKIDYSLLREPCFYIVCGNGFLILSIMVFSNIFLYPLGVEKGNSPFELASIISSKAIVDIVSRVAGPSIVTYFDLSVRKSYIFLGFMNGVSFAAVVFVDSYGKLMVWGMASGIAFGATTSLSGVLIVKTMGTQRLSSVLGLSAFIQGFFMLPMAPILGYIRDTTGSFVNIYLVLALMQFILITLWIIKPYLPQKPMQNPT